MQQEQNHKDIINDKALANTLFNKEALIAFETKQNQVPDDYFKGFERRILSEVKKKKNSAFVFNISKFGRIAIAASLLTIAITTYLFIHSNNKLESIAVNIDLQDIPTAEIDAYVQSNEMVAEIDWQEEINNESGSFEKLNSHLYKDSNNIQ